MDDLKPALETIRELTKGHDSDLPQAININVSIASSQGVAMAAGRDNCITDIISGDRLNRSIEHPTVSHRYAFHLLEGLEEQTVKEIIPLLLSHPGFQQQKHDKGSEKVTGDQDGR